MSNDDSLPDRLKHSHSTHRGRSANLGDCFDLIPNSVHLGRWACSGCRGVLATSWTLLDAGAVILNPRTRSSGHASRSMTIEASARPQSVFRRQMVTRMNVEPLSMNRDTVPPDYVQSESTVNQATWQRQIDGEALRWQDRPSSAPVAGATGISLCPLARDNKARQHLQLPPFKALGIVVPHPDFLLTPPYETDVKWNASSQGPSELPPTTPILRPTSDTSEGTTPETSHVHEFISERTINTPASTHTNTPGAMTEEIGRDEENNNDRSSWLEQAVDIAGKPRSVRHRPTPTDDMQRRQWQVTIQPRTCSMCSAIRNPARSRTRPYRRRPFLPP